MSARSFAAVLAAMALVALLAFGLASKGEEALAVGELAPDRELPLLDGEGEGSIGDYRGQWVLVNLWASWCAPCREESPALERFYRRHRNSRFTILGIDSQDLSSDGRAFVSEFGLTYPQLHDGEGKLSEDFGATGYPESFLVDPRGRLALIRRGPVDEAYLNEFVAPVLERAQ